ncbi:DUF6233 domain-containing protein [Streptomyces sp. NPDC053720]|uniref:DUF6233 domain-containing protein n=1 Tax=Streptomyces sp. NPDC053720 TaxID=3154855 RepID=UPI0034299CA0
MSGGISDLDKNRALAEWLAWQLRQVRGRIRDLEIAEQQERRRRERAHAAPRWEIQPQRSSSVALVHCGNCALYPVEGGFLDREEAVIALAEPDIEACQICRPETGLVDGYGCSDRPARSGRAGSQDRSVKLPIKVALAQAAPTTPEGPGWWYEPKLWTGLAAVHCPLG